MASGSLHVQLREPTDKDPVCWHRAGSYVDEGSTRTITTECGVTVVTEIGPESSEDFRRLVESPGKPGAKEHRCTGCYGK